MALEATMFRHAVYELYALNTELAKRVAERTTDLVDANTSIQRRAAKRARQVVAVVHDLHNTRSAVDAHLCVQELDVNDAQTVVTETIGRVTSAIAALRGNAPTIDEPIETASQPSTRRQSTSSRRYRLISRW
jgi:putative NADH-flavin reductase